MTFNFLLILMWYIILASGKQYALISDSVFVNYEITRPPCTVHTIGRLFHNFGYGLALPKGSPFTEKFTLAILKFRNNGVFERLADRWLKAGPCYKSGRLCCCMPIIAGTILEFV